MEQTTVLTREEVQARYQRDLAAVEEREQSEAEVKEAERQAELAQRKLDDARKAKESRDRTLASFQTDHVDRTSARLQDSAPDIAEYNRDVLAWCEMGKELQERRKALGYDAALSSFAQAFLKHPGWRNVFDDDEGAYLFFAEQLFELVDGIELLATPQVQHQGGTDSSSVVQRQIDHVWNNIQKRCIGNAHLGTWNVIKQRGYGQPMPRPVVEQDEPEEPQTTATIFAGDGTPIA